MTTRLKGFTVALEQDMREDDAEELMNAIRRLRGVLEVKPLESTSDDWIAEERARREIGGKLLDVLYPDRHGGRR